MTLKEFKHYYEVGPSLAQYFRQLGDIGSDPPRLIECEQFR
jgi:hypothetical protein